MFVRGIINDVATAGPAIRLAQQPDMAHPNGYRGYREPGYPAAPGSATPGRRRKACPSTRGAGLGADTRSSTQTNITEDLSLNLQWDVTERVGLNFDVQKIESDGRQLRQQLQQQDRARTSISTSAAASRNSRSRPPTGYGFTAGGFADPQNWFHEWTMEHAEDSTGDELAARLDADIKLDDEAGWIRCASACARPIANRT